MKIVVSESLSTFIGTETGNDIYEDNILLVYYTVQSIGSRWTFQRCVLPPSS